MITADATLSWCARFSSLACLRSFTSMFCEGGPRCSCSTGDSYTCGEGVSFEESWLFKLKYDCCLCKRARQLLALIKPRFCRSLLHSPQRHCQSLILANPVVVAKTGGAGRAYISGVSTMSHINRDQVGKVRSSLPPFVMLRRPRNGLLNQRRIPLSRFASVRV